MLMVRRMVILHRDLAIVGAKLNSSFAIVSALRHHASGHLAVR